MLVNGIRGKSSITRLCAGALRGGGLVTVAKTTGTAARFIYPDATEEPVYRKFGIANVIEQIGIVRRAAAFRPDALVIECMAVMPALQEINQTKLIQSTIGVLCNVREDHLAEMGPTLDDVARSLQPVDAGGRGLRHRRAGAAATSCRRRPTRRDCELIVVDPESVTDEEMRRLQLVHVQGERRDRAGGRRAARASTGSPRWTGCGTRRPIPACSPCRSYRRATTSICGSPTSSRPTTRSRRCMNIEQLLGQDADRAAAVRA